MQEVEKYKNIQRSAHKILKKELTYMFIYENAKIKYESHPSVQSLNHTMQLTTAVKTRDVSSIKI